MFDKDFPNLKAEGYLVTSPQTPSYNCIAWAAGDSKRWWWPDSFYTEFWPNTIPREDTVDAFIAMFTELKYVICDNDLLENGFEKVAIYANRNTVTHAARQLSNGKWTSKLGRSHDIEHTLAGLNGPTYGTVVQIMKRVKQSP